MRALDVLKHFNVLNVILLSLILFFAYYLLMPLASTTISVPPPEAKENVSEEGEADEKTEAVPSPIEFAMIAEQNLFHPDRKIPEKAGEKDLPKPEFVLYGTLITDDVSFAYMDDKKIPKKTGGREKRQTALKVGDTLSGFVLKTVEPDKVVMVRGEDAVEVKVIDPINKKREPLAVASKEPPKVTEQISSQKQIPVRGRTPAGTLRGSDLLQGRDDSRARAFDRAATVQDKLEALKGIGQAGPTTPERSRGR